MSRPIHVLFLSLIFSLFFTTHSQACTRVLHNDPQATLVGRNMDWHEEAGVKMLVYPRGITHQGRAKVNDMQWTSRYGSIVLEHFEEDNPALGSTAIDGINEKGFSAEVNSLLSADFGKREAQLPAISVQMWVQFYLSQFASVAEAVEYTKTHPFQVEPLFYEKLGVWMGLHLSMADASGDSAILEYSDGKLHIYHDRSYLVMTNDPSYDVQLQTLNQYIGLGGDKPLPGSTDANDRFIRASYYEKYLQPSRSIGEAVNAVLTILENAAQPEGSARPERPRLSKTIWRVIADLSHRKYYFQSKDHRQLLSAGLDSFTIEEGAPIKTFYPGNYPDATGDVSAYFY